MNVLGPIAAGLALGPLATKAFAQIGQTLSFSNLLTSTQDAPAAEGPAADETSAAEQLGALKEQLGQLLLASGVDLSNPITLGLTTTGEIEVRSAHLEAVAIEQILNADAQLRQRFLHTAALVTASPQEHATRTESLEQFEIEIHSI